jgi:hypothetical protein
MQARLAVLKWLFPSPETNWHAKPAPTKHQVMMGSSRLLTFTDDTVYVGEEMVDYHLETWDGGLNWYACQQGDDGMYILGHVDKVYPGLLKSLAYWEQMVTVSTTHQA